MIAVATDNSARRITAAEENSQRQYRGCPSKISRTLFFAIQETRGFGSDQQTKRWNDWKNSVDSFRGNYRHQDEPADAPTDQPKRPGRHLPECRANVPAARAKIGNRQSEHDRGPRKK